MTDHAEKIRAALYTYKQFIGLCKTYADRQEIEMCLGASVAKHLEPVLAELAAVTAERDAAIAMAEQYRQIILMDAGAPDDADDICCCGGKIGETVRDWPCTHGGCRSMADYYLATKLDALGVRGTTTPAGFDAAATEALK